MEHKRSVQLQLRDITAEANAGIYFCRQGNVYRTLSLNPVDCGHAVPGEGMLSVSFVVVVWVRAFGVGWTTLNRERIVSNSESHPRYTLLCRQDGGVAL